MCLQSQRQMLVQQRSGFATRVEAATRPVVKGSKRRRRLLVLGGGVALGAAVVTLNEDAKHAWSAAQRTYRVAATLALNIKEYAGDICGRRVQLNATDNRTATAIRSSATPTPTTRTS